MAGLKKGLFLGISGLAILSSVSLYSQNQKFSEKNLENKAQSHSINDTIKEESEYVLSKRKEFVENARKYIGKEYSWGGRLTEDNPGLDCLGLIFLPYSKTFNKKWTEISVNPSEIVEKGQLGKPVKELEGVLTKNIDFSKLKEGDVVYLLRTSEIKDKPLAKINRINYWPWHTGIYSNAKENLFLHANPENRVVEEDFKNYLELTSDGIFVTRIY